MLKLQTLLSNENYIVNNATRLNNGESIIIPDEDDNGELVTYVLEFLNYHKHFNTVGEEKEEGESNELDIYDENIKKSYKMKLMFNNSNEVMSNEVYKDSTGHVLKIKIDNKIMYMKIFNKVKAINRCSNKVVYPNYLLEGVVTILFNEIVKQYSDSYYNVHSLYKITFRNFYENRHINKEYMKWIRWYNINKEEQLDELYEAVIITDKIDKLDTPDDIIFIMFIVLHNIYVMQEKNKFIHGNFNFNNIYKLNINVNELTFNFDNKVIKLENKLKYIPVITNFSFSSIEYEGQRITPYIYLNRETIQYNDKYDMYTFIVHLYKYLYDINQSRLVNKLNMIFFKKEYRNNIKDILYANTEFNSELYDMLKPLDKVLNYILKYEIKQSILNDVKLPFYERKSNKIDTIVPDNTFELNNGITFKRKTGGSSMPMLFEDVVKRLKRIYLEYIEIDNDMGNFNASCCRENMMDYLLKNNNSVVISGTFSNSKGEYLEKIDMIKDKKGIVSVRNDGIDINYVNVIDQSGNNYRTKKVTCYDGGLFITGPILIYNKERIGFGNKTKKNGKFKYVCDENNKQEEDSNYENCNETTDIFFRLYLTDKKMYIGIKDNKTYFILNNFPINLARDLISNILDVDKLILIDIGDHCQISWNLDGKIYSTNQIDRRYTVSNIISFKF